MEAAVARGATRQRLEGERVSEVLQITLDVLAEVGYDRLTLDLVAARAHAGKATLYRRWASKAELVADALGHLEGEVTEPATGSLAGDMAVMLGKHQMLDPGQMKIACGVSTAMATDPELKAALGRRYIEPRRALMRRILRAASDRGEIDDGVDLELVSSIVPAMLIFWTMTEGYDTACTMAPKIIEQVLLPAVRRTAT